MPEQMTLKETVQAYLRAGPVIDKRKPGKGSFKPTQRLLADECGMQSETLSRKLSGTLPLTDYDMRAISSTLIWWGRINRRSQLHHLFALAGHTVPDTYWQQEPWRSLSDDTIPLRQPVQLSLLNASFEEWKREVPAKWLCNTKTGWVKPVAGRAAGSTALEVGGNRDNREWVYCRTRETQEIRVVPGSKICLTFWARKTQEGTHPERNKYVEVFFHDGFEWTWGFGQDITNRDEWVQYQTEWWDVPATVQKISVGAVVYKDGAFQVDDITLWMRTDR